MAEGEVEDEIERCAEQHDVDLIVIGHRDVSRVRPRLEGSTSQNRVQKAHVLVLLVHGGGYLSPYPAPAQRHNAAVGRGWRSQHRKGGLSS